MYKEDSAAVGSQGVLVTIVNKLWDGQARNRGSVPGRGKRFFSSLNIQSDLNPPSVLVNVYQGVFPGGGGV